MYRNSIFRIAAILLYLNLICHSQLVAQREISLQGEWTLLLDPQDEGTRQQYWNRNFSQRVILPGSLNSNEIGDTVTVDTPWTGSMFDSTFFTSEKYKVYREGRIRVPFWLTPKKVYVGPAWYRKTVDIPTDWQDQRVLLNLERCHWETSLYINGQFAGTRNSLISPHRFDVTPYLKTGSNSIVLRIDNRININIGPNSHSISDHTQTNWNGVIGSMSLQATPRIFIDNVRIKTDIKTGKITTTTTLQQGQNKHFEGILTIEVAGNNNILEVPVHMNNDTAQITNTYQLNDVKLWDEFSPHLYKMSVQLKSKDGRTVLSEHEDTFGVREISKSGTRITINGRPVFLRGDVDCAAFPLTGFPPTSEKEWEAIMLTAKNHGLNHLRFHSWCPPDAAFRVADRLGIYLYVEAPLWANQGSAVGTSGVVDQFIYDESLRIIKEYGNHPSFCFMSSGNEPGGGHQKEFLAKYVNFFRQYDDRRLYTSGAGWPAISENDFDVHSDARIQRWEEGLKSIINSQPPSTEYDWRDIIKTHKRPYVSHEIGQWCTYPNFDEIPKYNGVLEPRNFEIFQQTLKENGMAHQARSFLMASGKLQALCYKADIEAALRTPGFAGFELLGLHDFPGQGTALVGVLDAFWESKGYIKPEEYKNFCNETVLLSRMKKLLYKSSETLHANLEVAHFGAKELLNSTILWTLTDESGQIKKHGEILKDRIKIDNAQSIGSIAVPLSQFSKAQQLTLKVELKGTNFTNHWHLWVYPEKIKENTGKVLVVKELNEDVTKQLQGGATVLLEAFGKIKKEKGADIQIGFSTIFWNTSWTNQQAPHTLGLLINQKHPAFNNFPTDYHTDYQWHEIVTRSQPMMLEDFNHKLQPLIQPIDTWFENRKLALLFEAKVGKGRLLICSADLESDLQQRLSARQLRYSLINYANSKSFNPSTQVDIADINNLLIQSSH